MLDPTRALAELRRDGYSKLPMLTNRQVYEIGQWLKKRPVYPDCHVRKSAGPAGTWEQYKDKEVVCFHHHDVIRAPHVLEYALQLTDIAAQFLGKEPPVLYSFNCFYTRPGSHVRPDIQLFHQDSDDSKFLPLFILLTDVLKVEDGAQEIQFECKPTAQIMGQAGTAFFSDTSHPHRGLKPLTYERGIIWVRWGVTEKPDHKHAYVWDELKPLKKYKLGDRYPSDPRLQQSIRLMVE